MELEAGAGCYGDGRGGACPPCLGTNAHSVRLPGAPGLNPSERGVSFSLLSLSPGKELTEQMSTWVTRRLAWESSTYSALASLQRKLELWFHFTWESPVCVNVHTNPVFEIYTEGQRKLVQRPCLALRLPIFNLYPPLKALESCHLPCFCG